MPHTHARHIHAHAHKHKRTLCPPQATPHVSGIAARCFAAGVCKRAAGAGNRQRLLDAFWGNYVDDVAYRWPNDDPYGFPRLGGNKWYGALVSADLY